LARGRLGQPEATRAAALTAGARVAEEKDYSLTSGVAPDGRRKCGSVSSAIVDVLSAAESDLCIRDIQTSVEALLGSAVSRSSVKGYLHNRSRGRNPLFKRTARGRYRLSR
jgi:hypothetical protein